MAGDIPFPAITEGRIGGAVVQTVNARDLHRALMVGKVFAAWIVDRILTYEFNENSDFVVFSETGKNPSGGRPAKEYALTLDMAKEIAMVERNDEGRRVRQYFIECERRLRAQTAPPAIADLSDTDIVLRLLAEQVQGRIEDRRRVVEAEAQIQDMRPKVAALDRIAESFGSLCITDAAKTLQIPRDVLTRWLLEHKWIYRRLGSDTPIAYQPRLASGHLTHKTHTYDRGDGTEGTSTQVRVTPKGMTVLGAAFPPPAKAVA